MQFQADVLNTVTVRPKVVETTAMGAAFLAGLAVGYWKNLEEIQNIWQIDQYFNPTSERENINKDIKGWYKAINALEYFSSVLFLKNRPSLFIFNSSFFSKLNFSLI